MEWIPKDDVPRGELPAWARADGDGLLLAEEGLALRRGATGSWAAWSQVLGVVEDDDPAEGERVFVLVPRQPPRAPWFELRPADFPADIDTAEALARAVRTRADSAGYREAATRERLSPEALFERIRSREHLPGALEVPPAVQIPSSVSGMNAVTFLLLCAGFFGGLVVATLLAMAVGARDDDLSLFAMCGYFLGIALAIVVIRWQRRVMSERAVARAPRRRILVLAPDGCVIGLPEGPRVFPWDAIESFEAEWRADGEQYLVVKGAQGELGAVDARWFGAPLSLIVAVASVYDGRR